MLKILCDSKGWIKLHRGIFNTLVWEDSAAFRVYCSLLAAATHFDILDSATSPPTRLQPGQLLANQIEICDITGHTRRTVRRALDLLLAENAIACAFQQGQRSTVVTVNPFPFSLGGGEAKDGDCQPDSRTSSNAKNGQVVPGDNSNNDAVFDVGGELGTDISESENGTSLYMNKEYKELKNKKNILFSSSSVLLILSLWQNAREKAGEPYCEDPVTLEGAAAMAELWVDSGNATTAEIAAAMARFVHVVKTNEAAKLYTLKTLANSLGTYLDKPAAASAATVKRYSWTFTCDSCGYTSASFHLETEPPGPYSCRCMVDRDTHCTGTMIPKRDN